ncbi:MAG: hypothetical protein ABI685_14230 [Ferruginibacter sp.]
MAKHKHLFSVPFLLMMLFYISVQTIKAQSVTGSTSGDSASSLPLQTTTLRNPKWAFSGYLKDLQYIQINKIDQPWILDNLIHNRLDVHWYPDSAWKVHLGLRNRFFYGESVSIYTANKSLLENSNSFFDLSKVIAQGPSYLLHSTIDRASIDYSKGKWQLTAGRQRINWGLNMVWNPNDIFNAYSYFDFDYEERPGADALRVQYYLNSTSSAEIAYKPGRKSDSSIIAALYRFNYKSYDFQFLAGKVNADYVLGGGWSGVLGAAGFNGEITTFIPDGTTFFSHSVISASAGVNYTFNNSLYLHGAYLYNSAGVLNASGSQTNLLLENVSAKNLSPAKHSVFAEAAYQFTPLIHGDIAGIIDPADGSFFTGPFFTFSLTNNLEFLAGGQLFFGKKGSLYGDYGKLIYFRLKWSF